MFWQEPWFDSWSIPYKSVFLCRSACSADTAAASYSLLSPSLEPRHLVDTASLRTSACIKKQFKSNQIPFYSQVDFLFELTWIMSQVETQELISSEAICVSFFPDPINPSSVTRSPVFKGGRLWWWSKLPLAWSWCFILDTTELSSGWWYSPIEAKACWTIFPAFSSSFTEDAAYNPPQWNQVKTKHRLVSLWLLYT